MSKAEDILSSFGESSITEEKINAKSLSKAKVVLDVLQSTTVGELKNLSPEDLAKINKMLQTSENIFVEIATLLKSVVDKSSADKLDKIL